MTAVELDEEILQFIECGGQDDEAFNDLALKIFAYQFERNEAYRNFCLKRKRTPETVSHWTEIPPVPTQAFKVLDLVCEPKEQAEAVFLSSGTTQGEGKRSKHFIFNLRLYDTSVLKWFEPHLLPERRKMPISVLFPPPEELPTSSLGHMLATVMREWEAERGLRSGWFIRSNRLQAEELANWLKRAEENGESVMLLGTSFSFVHFLDWCAANKRSFRLPSGSRLMDTGGFKGRSREVTRNELYHLYERVLGIAQDWCVNEYGMAELSSQFYDGVVGSPYFLSRNQQRAHKPPHWARTRVLKPESLDEVGDGEVGLLCHYDLANRGSVIAVLTEDLGIKVESGFLLLGRATGTELRGCSVLIEELLSV